MTQVKIHLNNAQDAQSAVDAVLSVQLKLEKIVAALQHTNATPDYKYLINYMVGSIGTSVAVSSTGLSDECSKIGLRLANAGVLELLPEGSYAEISHATLDYMIEEKMRGDTLVIKGSEIRYKIKEGKSQSPWKTLSDKVQIVVTKLELTDEDRLEFRQRQMQEALAAVVKLGYTIDESGTLVVV